MAGGAPRELRVFCTEVTGLSRERQREQMQFQVGFQGDYENERLKSERYKLLRGAERRAYCVNMAIPPNDGGPSVEMTVRWELKSAKEETYS